MCRNPKLWIVLGALAALLVVASPSLGAVVPFLLIAACPLMMVLMAGGMAGMVRREPGDEAADAGEAELARLRAEVAELRQHTSP